MQIQPSILIWTVISFLVLAFVLNRFLFKPLLRVMDERNRKIRERREQIRTQRKDYEAELQALEERRAEERRIALEREGSALEQLRAESRRTLEKKRDSNERELLAYREQLKEESARLESELADKIDELALAYAKTLVS